jgi:hypoxanthine phosphoribosyltransferase
VPWHYEPRSFPIAWNGDGTPTKYFTPDFYLPDDDLYIEITTMSQKLVTKKNGKLRRLKELYPEITCKLFWRSHQRRPGCRGGPPWCVSRSVASV